ncbi:MAG: N-6 DNA methylase [Acidobacteria bacterium]|nr:N-6 DNA methylase [Acidobacteriota bacterium]
MVAYAASGGSGTMSGTTKKLSAAVEEYFADLRRVRASGAATPERSLYGPLGDLLKAVGATLKPKVFCVQEPADLGAGHPDFGLYAAKQLQRGTPREGQTPERGVVEVKPPADDAWLTADGRQASRYWGRYRLVLVTNARDFVLVGEDPHGKPAILETLRLAGSEDEFLSRLDNPHAFARDAGARLGEYLARALAHRAALAEPRDLAWLLASYARDGLARVEAAGGVPQLGAVRSALEDALGIRFEGDRGQRFFCSTLVQTLFYGIFSAWVLWARTDAATPAPGRPFTGVPDDGRFRWREAVWHLRAPVLRALFQQIADPGRLQPLGLTEVLNWTAAALDRVDRTAFFARFNQGEAVPYFYEPFLEAFDPDLRKQLGVWYTPSEVVRYMVARVDRALKHDLGIPDGLAADNVYVLDPCCGTGAYLAEVLRCIAANLGGRGLGALVGAGVKHAAMKRVFGFEIMPAPFVVAHLQVGVTMQDLDAPLADDGTERAGVYLTNALTGWEPRTDKPALLFPELEEERDRAERVKQERPILVILGNPPYNGFAGMAVDEERELSDAYRSTKHVRPPEGQGLNDLYIRFFRMAERRIAERTGRGVVCFISNYSWLDGLSFTGMREKYLEAFDAIRIDCLNGDKYKTGKVAPDGSPDPSIFSTDGDPVGIQVGTAIAMLIRKADHRPTGEIGFRHLWGQAKPQELMATADLQPVALYDELKPVLRLGLPFVRTAVSDQWFDWPALSDLFRVSFPGVKTSRDGFLVDIDLDRLRARVRDYFNPDVSHEEVARCHPGAMKTTTGFNARKVRDALLARGGPNESGFVRFAYRPFDTRWLYWEADNLLDRPRPDYRPHVFEGNLWLVFQNAARPDLSPPLAIRYLGDLNQMNSGVYCVPAFLSADGLEAAVDQKQRRPNLSGITHTYLTRLDADVLDLVHHVTAVLHEPTYNRVNADALRAEGPRVPLPGWGDGANEEAAEALAHSVARGREIARLLDSETPVPGVTDGTLRPGIATIAVPATTDGRNMVGEDFAVTAGWGHSGSGDAVMPGQGRAVERAYTPSERAALGDDARVLGGTTFDIYLNDNACWCNVPVAVWTYKLGGYQVLKKWLSYRERGILKRALTATEVAGLMKIARRIAAILTIYASEPASSVLPE